MSLECPNILHNSGPFNDLAGFELAPSYGTGLSLSVSFPKHERMANSQGALDKIKVSLRENKISTRNSRPDGIAFADRARDFVRLEMRLDDPHRSNDLIYNTLNIGIFSVANILKPYAEFGIWNIYQDHNDGRACDMACKLHVFGNSRGDDKVAEGA
ncbi:hypothetical protein ACLOJK_011455 [Asimina triloba]